VGADAVSVVYATNGEAKRPVLVAAG
jgi:hypothetical protein